MLECLGYKNSKRTGNEKIFALVVAAGLSSRMGEFKPCLPFKKKTIIESTLDSLFAVQVQKIVVVTGYRSKMIFNLLKDKYKNKLILVENENFADTDMFYSIQVGCSVMPECEAFFLLPVDMPMIKAFTYLRLIEARAQNPEKKVFFPLLDGYRKHPPLIDYSLIPAICSYNSKRGLRSFWDNIPDETMDVPVKDKAVAVDLDTWENYQKYNRIDSKSLN